MCLKLINRVASEKKRGKRHAQLETPKDLYTRLKASTYHHGIHASRASQIASFIVEMTVKKEGRFFGRVVVIPEDAERPVRGKRLGRVEYISRAFSPKQLFHRKLSPGGLIFGISSRCLDCISRRDLEPFFVRENNFSILRSSRQIHRRKRPVVEIYALDLSYSACSSLL